jgi:hypothetical protein
VKRPTEVRLDESMLEDFKKRIMIGQTRNPVAQTLEQQKRIYTPVS